MRFYDWDKTFSYQTGTNGEICVISGAKDIGKTFGLRKKCVERFIKHRELFCEICRTNVEMRAVMRGYFDKLQAEGFFSDYVFKVEKLCGYIAKRPRDDSKPDYSLLCYFVALTNFQMEKKRTYLSPKRYIFDEAIIDPLDKYHRYLPNEFLILSQLLDSISRQQPRLTSNYYVYLLGNSVDFLTCPYFRAFGIDKVPEFGYHYYRNKTVLFHYVEPWDSDDRKAYTLVGRLLAGHNESRVIFDNEFKQANGSLICRKSPQASYAFAIRWGSVIFSIWMDHSLGLWYVSERLPKDASNIYALTKRDMTIDYSMAHKTSDLMKSIISMHDLNCLRYESAYLRESFFEVLSFLGIR